MGSANEKKMIFTDPETEEKIDELLAKMTLEEKIGQICQVGRLRSEALRSVKNRRRSC